jgi:predicted metal-dependent hydrolase
MKVGGKSMKNDQEKYAATYKIGNTTIHVVAPPPMTDEEIERVLDNLHAAVWDIIQEMLQKEAEKNEEKE